MNHSTNFKNYNDPQPLHPNFTTLLYLKLWSSVWNHVCVSSVSYKTLELILAPLLDVCNSPWTASEWDHILSVLSAPAADLWDGQGHEDSWEGAPGGIRTSASFISDEGQIHATLTITPPPLSHPFIFYPLLFPRRSIIIACFLCLCFCTPLPPFFLSIT